MTQCVNPPRLSQISSLIGLYYFRKQIFGIFLARDTNFAPKKVFFKIVDFHDLFTVYTSGRTSDFDS